MSVQWERMLGGNGYKAGKRQRGLEALLNLGSAHIVVNILDIRWEKKRPIRNIQKWGRRTVKFSFGNGLKKKSVGGL